MSDAGITILADGLDHPEGIAWDGERLVAGGEAGQLYRVGLDGSVEQLAATGGFVLGVCLDAAGAVYACDAGRRAVMRITPQGEVSTYATGTGARAMANPNWPVFDDAGNLLVSDSGTWAADDGCLWRVAPGGQTQVLSDAVRAFPNGMALSADGTGLYVAESHARRVVRLDLVSGRVEHVVGLPERALPDGLAFDAAGGLLISCYTPDVIFRLVPGGELETLAEDWTRLRLASPTNVAFFGPGLDRLAVACLGRWHLAECAPPHPGLPLRRPADPTR